MIRRLDRYVFRIFLASLAAGVLFAAGLLVLTDQFQHFDEMVQASRKLREAGHKELAGQVLPMALRFYAYEVAIRFFQYCPFVTFFAAVFTASRLHRTNETVAMLATGTSLQRGFMVVFLGAAAIATIQIGFREYLLPRMAADQALVRSVIIDYNPRYVVDDVSVVDELGNHYSFSHYDPAEASGTGFSAYSADQNVYKSISAKSARFETRPAGLSLILTGGRYYSVGREGGKGGDSVVIDELPPEFVIKPADCEVAARAKGDPDYLSITELDTIARRMPNVARFQISLHSVFTLAIANFILPLLGLPCVLRADRRTTLEGAVFAFMLCVLYFAATLFCYQLGAHNTLGAVFAAWLPTVIFGSLGIALFEGMRT